MLRSVRSRATAGALVVVAIALIVGAVIFLGSLRSALVSSAVASAESTAESLSESIEEAGTKALSNVDDDDIVQITNASGTVVATTEEAGGVNLSLVRDVTIDGETYRVVSEDVEDTDLTVWVGYEIDDDAIAVVRHLLLIAIPLLILIVGIITWKVTARALAPVHKIRADVDQMSATALDRRVPVPDTGDEIAALAVTMNNMLDRIEQGAKAQRQFVSDASHELRSPLATIRQHAELAVAHPDVMEQEELAQVVLGEGKRMQDMVDSLLMLARLDEGARADWRAVDLDDIAMAEAARVRDRISVDTSGIRAARVLGDSRLLSHVVRNLVDNAVRHAKGQIAITTFVDGPYTVLGVEDDGNGILPEDRQRIFERFVRLDESRARDAGGAGLGLAIVQSIVNAHAGWITVDESRWAGARFTVVMPRHQS